MRPIAIAAAATLLLTAGAVQATTIGYAGTTYLFATDKTSVLIEQEGTDPTGQTGRTGHGLPRFDSSLGTLTAVQIVVEASWLSFGSLTSTSPNPSDSTVRLVTEATLTNLPNGTPIPMYDDLRGQRTYLNVANGQTVPWGVAGSKCNFPPGTFLLHTPATDQECYLLSTFTPPAFPGFTTGVPDLFNETYTSNLTPWIASSPADYFNVLVTTLTTFAVVGAGGNFSTNLNTDMFVDLYVTYTYDTPVPAPLALVGLGLGLLGVLRWRRNPA